MASDVTSCGTRSVAVGFPLAPVSGRSARRPTRIAGGLWRWRSCPITCTCSWRLIRLTVLPGSPTKSRGPPGGGCAPSSLARGTSCRSCGPGRISRPRSARCPWRPRAGTAARRTGGRGGRSGHGETRLQVPRLPDASARRPRGAPARGSLRSVQRGAGGAARSVAYGPGEHQLRHAVRPAERHPPRRPARPRTPLVHRPAADPAAAQHRVCRLLCAGEEGKSGLPPVQALPPVPPGRVRHRRRREVDPRSGRRVGTGGLSGCWFGQGPPAPASPRDGQSSCS
jgi:hypothetical protein